MIVIFNRAPLVPEGSSVAVDTKETRVSQLPPIERGSFESAVRHLTLSSSMISSALGDGIEVLALNSSLAPSLICRTVSPTTDEDEGKLLGEIAINLLKVWEAQGLQFFSLGHDIEEGIRYEDGLDREISLSSEHSRLSPDMRRVFTHITSKEVRS